MYELLYRKLSNHQVSLPLKKRKEKYSKDTEHEANRITTLPISLMPIIIRVFLLCISLVITQLCVSGLVANSGLHSIPQSPFQWWPNSLIILGYP